MAAPDVASLPTRERELKPRRVGNSMKTRKSLPTRERELKRRRHRLWIRRGLVAPYTGA